MVFASVIILAHKLDDVFKECLLKINHQSTNDYEVIVVSDNSDSVEKYVRNTHPDFVVLNTHYEGVGIAKGRNLGGSQAKGKLLIYLDSDCLCEDNHVQTYIDAYEPECLLAGGIDYWDEDFNEIFHKDKRLPFQNISSKTMWRFEHIWSINAFGDFHTGNCGVDKQSWESIGGFNEELKDYNHEDIYFSLEHCIHYGRLKFVNNVVKHRGLSSGYDNINYNYELFKELVFQNYPEQFYLVENL